MTSNDLYLSGDTFLMAISINLSTPIFNFHTVKTWCHFLLSTPLKMLKGSNTNKYHIRNKYLNIRIIGWESMTVPYLPKKSSSLEMRSLPSLFIVLIIAAGPCSALWLHQTLLTWNIKEKIVTLNSEWLLKCKVRVTSPHISSHSLNRIHLVLHWNCSVLLCIN